MNTLKKITLQQLKTLLPKDLLEQLAKEYQNEEFSILKQIIDTKIYESYLDREDTFQKTISFLLSINKNRRKDILKKYRHELNLK